jgi:hypothetical protein
MEDGRRQGGFRSRPIRIPGQVRLVLAAKSIAQTDTEVPDRDERHEKKKSEHVRKGWR